MTVSAGVGLPISDISMLYMLKGMKMIGVVSSRGTGSRKIILLGLYPTSARSMFLPSCSRCTITGSMRPLSNRSRIVATS